MITPPPPIGLMESRSAAAAKLAYAMQQPAGVAILCGPPGSGISTTLSLLAESPLLAGRQVRLRTLADWESDPTEAPLPDVVLADEAHACDGVALVRLLQRCRRRRPAAGLVLAGQGRLLSLVARDGSLERAVVLRAVLQPFTRGETRLMLDATLFTPGKARPAACDHDAVVLAIHEIAAGMPGAIARLADLAAVVAASRPDRSLAARDIEAIHRRLSLQAA